VPLWPEPEPEAVEDACDFVDCGLEAAPTPAPPLMAAAAVVEPTPTIAGPKLDPPPAECVLPAALPRFEGLSKIEAGRWGTGRGGVWAPPIPPFADVVAALPPVAEEETDIETEDA